jgi:hypothetical protein
MRPYVAKFPSVSLPFVNVVIADHPDLVAAARTIGG